MANWDGTRWLENVPATASPPPTRRRRLLGAAAEGALITTLIFGLIASTTFAAKGGNGNGGGNGHGNNTAVATTAGCTVDGVTVSGYGLPTDQVLNFFVTDASGTSGWVLGFTDTGAWDVSVPERTGPTVYEFASRTWGPMGRYYDVFAACSAQ